MAMGARSTMKKSLLLILIVCPLTITVTDCAKDIPASRGNKICGATSKTWPGWQLCGKTGTCNKPCKEEGFEEGYCGFFLLQ
ncbi:hypothetical protein ZWY2020_010223 [Hordeum vulgare]|nr:hypothetical protein ZWY2020_010223 [Hordeum vulgare]